MHQQARMITFIVQDELLKRQDELTIGSDHYITDLIDDAHTAA
jgi:hypothetical protein